METIRTETPDGSPRGGAIIVMAGSRDKVRGPALPQTLPFGTTLEVRAADINAGAHLGHDRAVALLHEVRLRLLAACDAGELDPSGVGLILLELHVAYHAQARWGEVLAAQAGILVATPLRLALGYCLRHPAGLQLLTARTDMAFFDYRSGKPARAPKALLARLQPFTVHPGVE